VFFFNSGVKLIKKNLKKKEKIKRKNEEK